MWETWFCFVGDLCDVWFLAWIKGLNLGIIFIFWGLLKQIQGDPAYPAHFFKKPWFLELLMFIGMTMSFPLHWAVESFSKPKSGTRGESLLSVEVKDRGWKVRALIFLPAMGDLVGSILSFTGLVYISNSTAQMLGSSIIIMVAVNSYIFLGRRYNKIQYAGMFIVLASLLIVGYAADMAARDDSNSKVLQASASEQAFGMFFSWIGHLGSFHQTRLNTFGFRNKKKSRYLYQSKPSISTSCATFFGPKTSPKTIPRKHLNKNMKNIGPKQKRAVWQSDPDVFLARLTQFWAEVSLCLGTSCEQHPIRFGGEGHGRVRLPPLWGHRDWRCLWLIDARRDKTQDTALWVLYGCCVASRSWKELQRPVKIYGMVVG